MPACQICLQSAQSKTLQQHKGFQPRLLCQQSSMWVLGASPKLGFRQALHPLGLGCCGINPQGASCALGTHFLISVFGEGCWTPSTATIRHCQRWNSLKIPAFQLCREIPFPLGQQGVRLALGNIPREERLGMC